MSKNCPAWKAYQFRRACYRPPRVQVHRQHARERGIGPRVAATAGQLPVWAIPGGRPQHPEAYQSDAHPPTAIDEPGWLAGLHRHGEFRSSLNQWKITVQSVEEFIFPEHSRTLSFVTEIPCVSLKARDLTSRDNHALKIQTFSWCSLRMRICINSMTAERFPPWYTCASSNDRMQNNKIHWDTFSATMLSVKEITS